MADALFLGSHITPLVFLEVIPLVAKSKDPPNIVNAFTKSYLIEQGVKVVNEWTAGTSDDGVSTPCRGFLKIDGATYYGHQVVHVPNLNPLSSEPCLCLVVGYGFPVDTSHTQVIVTDSTLVRILPHRFIEILPDKEIKFVQSHVGGELPAPELSADVENELRSNHEASTLQTLKLHMSMLLSTPISIGTTEDALFNYKKLRRRGHGMQRNLAVYTGKAAPQATDTPNKNSTKLGGALTVHSPQHGAGKTLLVRSVAKELGCRVYFIEVAPLLAQYGVHADAALETLVHSIVVSSGIQGQRVCILFDHLQAFVPMKKTNDASLPILISMASYLPTMTKSIQKQELPFPTKNPLYNLKGSNGQVLKVHVCMVGVVTCQDSNRKSRSLEVLNMLQGAQYRLPDLTTAGRIDAVSRALGGIQLSEEAKQRLPGLVASRVGLRGRDFERIKRRLEQLMHSRAEATVDDLVGALATVQQVKKAQYEVVINSSNQSSNGDLFSSVGGNTEAKLALQDALAIDPRKSAMLKKFGMSPPSGVLLYGPPGTGKTLLARAVAKLLNSQTSTGVGGAFFSLQASEIVRSEVGNSEKELALAFQTARANAPSVIFIDEFQALFTERTGGSGSQLASTLLHCMDDISRWQESDDAAGDKSRRIVVMGATNTPWMIDTAFLRAGRFDKVVHVGLPTQVERESILQVHIGRMRLNDGSQCNQLCKELAPKTDGFSGADLAALCRSAAVRCLCDLGEEGSVHESHFLEALRDDINATSSQVLVEKLYKWRP